MLEHAPGQARMAERKEHPMDIVFVAPTADIRPTEAARF